MPSTRLSAIFAGAGVILGLAPIVAGIVIGGGVGVALFPVVSVGVAGGGTPLWYGLFGGSVRDLVSRVFGLVALENAAISAVFFALGTWHWATGASASGAFSTGLAMIGTSVLAIVAT